MLGKLGFLHVSGPPDQRLAQLLAAQHGCVARRQLLAAGLSHSQIQTRLARGQLQPIHRGVYTAAGMLGLPLRLEAAALLACGPAATLARMTAARLWRLTPPCRAIAVELSLATGERGRTRKGIEIRQTATLTRKDIRFRHGLPVTSPERSLIDIAALLTVSTRQLEQALDEALGQRLTTLAKLSGRIAANPTQPGAARLEHLLDVRTTSTITKREAEARFLELIRRAPEYRRVTWQQMTTDALELIADVAATIARRTA